MKNQPDQPKKPDIPSPGEFPEFTPPAEPANPIPEKNPEINPVKEPYIPGQPKEIPRPPEK